MCISANTVRRYLTGSLMAMAATIGGREAVGQPFELLYGTANAQQSATNGTRPVTQCWRGGFVAVGTNPVPMTSPMDWDVYVVRTDPAGNVVWEMTYDVNGRGSLDEGTSIAERPGGGFYVTGRTIVAGDDSDIFIMEIDCDGNEVWTSIYDADEYEYAKDIIVSGTGDILVAGYTTRNVGSQALADGLILRTNPTGATIFMNAYDIERYDVFNAIAETQTGAGLGGLYDIVVAGYAMGTGTNLRQGLMMRVGQAGGWSPLASASLHAAPQNRELTNVVERTMPGINQGDLVFVGNALDNGMQRAWAIETQRNVCSELGLSRWFCGDLNTGTDYPAFAYDLAETRIELQHGGNKGSIDDIVVTGGAMSVYTPTSREAYAVTLDNALMPRPWLCMLYGDHATKNETGYSISMAGAGVIIGGEAMMHPVDPADPRDLYLIRTQLDLSTYCSHAWAPNHGDFVYAPECRTPVIVDHGTETVADMAFEALSTRVEACSIVPFFGKHTTGESGVSQQEHAFPNPVPSGSVATIVFASVKEGRGTVVVRNAAGEVVAEFQRQSSGGDVDVAIDTRGWSAGAYGVSFEIDGERATARLVVQ